MVWIYSEVSQSYLKKHVGSLQVLQYKDENTYVVRNEFFALKTNV